MQSHLFGASPSPSVATFALHQCARDNSKDFSLEAVLTVLMNFYVDDMLKSCKDEATAIRLYEEVSDLLSRGGFKLTKWVSNSKVVLEAIPEDQLAKSVKGFQELDEKCYQPMEHALGVRYDVKDDTFAVEIAEQRLQVIPNTCLRLR